jgi:hypothetical protein
VGGLGHYFEDEGLPTTQISLIREHTIQIRPPRALWVPFELGRPLGAPNDPAFQTRVLTEALKLLEAFQGPVLKDFAEDVPQHHAYGGPPACPIDFQARTEPVSEVGQLLKAFKEEFSQMQSWYDLARQERGRTTAQTSGSDAEKLIDVITGFVEKRSLAVADEQISQGTALRTAVEDLKAYYLEAVSIQPGQPVDSRSLADWFWGQTAAAQVIQKIREICKESRDDSLKHTTHALIPKNQLHRFE